MTILYHQQTKTNVEQERLAVLRTQAVKIPRAPIAVNATEDYNYGITNAMVRFTHCKVQTGSFFLPGKREENCLKMDLFKRGNYLISIISAFKPRMKVRGAGKKLLIFYCEFSHLISPFHNARMGP